MSNARQLEWESEHLAIPMKDQQGMDSGLLKVDVLLGRVQTTRLSAIHAIIPVCTTDAG